MLIRPPLLEGRADLASREYVTLAATRDALFLRLMFGTLREKHAQKLAEEVA